VNEVYSQAFIILIVGMLTVFTILMLIVLAGQALIRITNRFDASASAKVSTSSKHAIDPTEIAVITAAVSHLTGGTGNIDKIKKLP
jgi:oxaloacetate decarboxylase gamma subunit